MPIRAIYTFHNLLSRRFIFFEMWQKPAVVYNPLIAERILKNSRVRFQKISYIMGVYKTVVYLSMFVPLLAQPLMPLRTIKIIKKCGARIKAYQMHCFSALALSLFFGTCKKQRIEYVFWTNNSLLYRQNIKKSKLYV